MFFKAIKMVPWQKGEEKKCVEEVVNALSLEMNGAGGGGNMDGLLCTKNKELCECVCMWLFMS